MAAVVHDFYHEVYINKTEYKGTDFQKAFYSIKKKSMFAILHSYDIPKQIVNAI